MDEWDFSSRNLTEHGATAHHATLRERIIGRGAMHHAAVVPYDQLARLPAMLVREIRMNGESVELLYERASLRVGHADDGLRVVAQVDALAAGFGVRPHDRMIDGRCLEPLRLGHRFLAVTARPGEIQVMHGAQGGDARLPRRIEAFIGPVHVAEVRLSAALRDNFAIDHGRLARDPAPGAVGMPCERALVGMPAVRIPVLVEVRETIKLRMAIGVILAHHVNLQLAEFSSEAHLTIGGKLLRRGQQGPRTDTPPLNGAPNLRLAAP